MKKFVKVALCLTLVMAFVLAFASCGSSFSLETVAGTWEITKVNDMTYDEYCASVGIDPATSQSTWTITADSVSATGNGQTVEYETAVKSDGFQVLMNGEVFMSVKYDADADTLTYSVQFDENTIYTYVLGRV